MSAEDQPLIWRAVLGAVEALTKAQPGASEYGSPGSGWWHAPQGSSRSAGDYSNDGRRVTCTFDVGYGDERQRYVITVEDVAA